MIMQLNKKCKLHILNSNGNQISIIITELTLLLKRDTARYVGKIEEQIILSLPLGYLFALSLCFISYCRSGSLSHHCSPGNPTGHMPIGYPILIFLSIFSFGYVLPTITAQGRRCFDINIRILSFFRQPIFCILWTSEFLLGRISLFGMTFSRKKRIASKDAYIIFVNSCKYLYLN